MWNLVLVRLETLLVSVQDRCMVCAKRTIGSKIIFLIHRVELLGDVGHLESCFSLLEMLLVLVQDSCTVYAECTIGSKILLDTLNALVGDEAQVEARFGPFRDSANLDARSEHGLHRM
jgi:hypothetical protein